MAEYKVSKLENVTRLCGICGGLGYKLKANTTGQKFKANCPHCIEGRYTYENRTEVTLLEALKDLGLIK